MAAVSFILTMRLGGIDRVCDVGQIAWLTDDDLEARSNGTWSFEET